jgi:hypothetical protein
LDKTDIMPLYPKQFIEITFLSQYKQIVYEQEFHYISFALVCIGIEFLGKCLDSQHDWHEERLSRVHFEQAIKNLMPQYEPYTVVLYRNLRSGFAHGLLPGPEVALTHRAESQQYGTKHLQAFRNTGITLIIEDFYDDFENACKHVLSATFPLGDKMERALLGLPSDATI